MSDRVSIKIELIDTIPEIQLIQLLMDASKCFDDQITLEEKERAVAYFRNWYSQTKANPEPN